jgi:hypothetical protein
MDIYQDFIRREARAIDIEHRRAMRTDAATLDRLVNGDGAELAAETKADVIFGGLNRRRFLLFGGTAIATSAVFAACKGAIPSKATVPAAPATTAPTGSAKDITILRTASSIEALAVDVYGKAITSGLVKTPAVVSFAKLFQSQHQQHADLFERSTKNAGGTPFTMPNPVLMAQVQPRLAALRTELDVVTLAYDLEHLAAATYQGDIGLFDNPRFNTTIASVGSTEARHVALLAVVSGKSATGTPDNAFQADQDAVKPGTGVGSV